MREIHRQYRDGVVVVEHAKEKQREMQRRQKEGNKTKKFVDPTLDSAAIAHNLAEVLIKTQEEAAEEEERAQDATLAEELDIQASALSKKMLSVEESEDVGLKMLEKVRLSVLAAQKAQKKERRERRRERG